MSIGYAEEGVQQIVEKCREERTSLQNIIKGPELLMKPEDLTTRVFLRYHRMLFQFAYILFFSHKRSTGQGLVGRLYEGLKDWYKIFLDSEAQFKIHNLKEIVKRTEVFVFVLTHGILLSHWCLEELHSALENKKKVKNKLCGK